MLRAPNTCPFPPAIHSGKREQTLRRDPTTPWAFPYAGQCLSGKCIHLIRILRPYYAPDAVLGGEMASWEVAAFVNQTGQGPALTA